LKIHLITICTLLLSQTAFAGRITTNPIASFGDTVISTAIQKTGGKNFKVLVKTDLETFAITMSSYADASALRLDLKKNSVTHCKMKSNLRVKATSDCSLVEVRFED